MARFPSWLHGQRAKVKALLPKMEKCSKCGHVSNKAAVDREGNYRCLICGALISKKRKY
jgi:transcription elongation factor Elf1